MANNEKATVCAATLRFLSICLSAQGTFNTYVEIPVGGLA